MVPEDIKGMKIRPAHATIAAFVTQLGGTNVQAGAPEVRDVLEKGVADAVTFPWGSIPLFGIDKVVKYHMDAPLYVSDFALVFNKDKYNQMSPAQKKVIDDHCRNEWAVRIAKPWAEFEHAGIAKLRAEPGHDVYPITAEQLAQEKGRRALAENVGRFRPQGRARSGRRHAGAEGGTRESRRRRELTKATRGHRSGAAVRRPKGGSHVRGRTGCVGARA